MQSAQDNVIKTEIGFDEFEHHFFNSQYYQTLKERYDAPIEEIEEFDAWFISLESAHLNAEFILNEIDNEIVFELHQFDTEFDETFEVYNYYDTNSIYDTDSIFGTDIER